MKYAQGTEVHEYVPVSGFAPIEVEDVGRCAICGEYREHATHSISASREHTAHQRLKKRGKR